MKFGTTRHKFGTNPAKGFFPCPKIRRQRLIYMSMPTYLRKCRERTKRIFEEGSQDSLLLNSPIAFTTIDGGNMNIRTYTKTYALFRDICEDEQERIKDSSECRKYVLKNIKSADYQTLIKKMANCIYDLTGDSLFRDQVYQELGRRQHE